MRIIAGKYKSRSIYLPKTGINKGAKFPLRPTSDRARETLFDVLNNYIEFKSVKCLDLCSGTGALGLEALSRGAESCCFVDVSMAALNSVKTTAAELGCEEACEFVKDDALKFLSANRAVYFDIIFADPPYSYDSYVLLAEKALMLKPQVFVLELSSEPWHEFSAVNYNVIKKKAGSAEFIIFLLK